MEIIIVLSLAVVFLAGVLAIAVVLYFRHGDSSASYKLFALRDRLIRLNIEKKVSADDPWFRYTYDGVNSLLWCSNALSGVDGWMVAKIAGKKVAKSAFDEECGKVVRPRKESGIDGNPPEELVPVFHSLRDALDDLLNSHIGWMTFHNSRAREYVRLYKTQAKELDTVVSHALGNRAHAH